jgi:high-affinity iron transporter
VRGLQRRTAAAIATTLWLVVAAMGEPSPSPSATPAATSEAERLVFLLQYVGSDYGAAVQHGKIVDDAEYRENREFTALIAERFARLRSAIPPAKLPALDDAIGKLQQLVSNRADPALVREVTESAIPRLVEVFDLRSFPRQRPDPEQAGRLYAENCTPCHGSHGGGDGLRVKDLDPPPARFTDPARMNGTAPYVFYNAITLGVANTAMASFADSLSDQERWDLAFFLWTFLLPPGQRSEAHDVVLSLRDLGTRSSVELAPEVIRQAASHGERIDPAQAALRVAQLRAHPPVLSDAQERLARLRQDLARSVSLIERGDTEGAADAVTTAYLTEFEPLEPEIDRRDPRIRQSFERGLIDFRSALRRGDREAALAMARTLTETVDRAADLLDETREQRVSRRRLVIAGLAIVGVIALLAAAARIGKARRVR